MNLCVVEWQIREYVVNNVCIYDVVSLVVEEGTQRPVHRAQGTPNTVKNRHMHVSASHLTANTTGSTVCFTNLSQVHS